MTLSFTTPGRFIPTLTLTVCSSPRSLRILFGLAAIKNVGRHAVESIVALREADGPFKSLEALCERTSAIQDVNRRVLEALVQSGACDSLGDRAAPAPPG